jgi:hypothetical protein
VHFLVAFFSGNSQSRELLHISNSSSNEDTGASFTSSEKRHGNLEFHSLFAEIAAAKTDPPRDLSMHVATSAPKASVFTQAKKFTLARTRERLSTASMASATEANSSSGCGSSNAFGASTTATSSLAFRIGGIASCERFQNVSESACILLPLPHEPVNALVVARILPGKLDRLMPSPSLNPPSADWPSQYAFTIWPSLILGATLAFLVPTQWIHHADRYRPSFFNFHPLVLFVYVPLAFGLFWPMFVALHAALVPSLGVARPGRITCAQALFVLSLVLAAPCVLLEVRALEALEAQRNAEAELRRKAAELDETKRRQASSEILAKGVLAFSEPLTPAQSWALSDYFVLHTLANDDCLHAAAQYHSSLVVLTRLAANKSCSPDGLQALYDDALVIQSQQAPTAYPNVDSLLIAIARNLGTPPDLLAKLVQHHLFGVRMEAARNPQTPKPAKIAYLHNILSSANFDERQYAAGDRDTPPDVLEQLATEPRFLRALANNPSTPRPILQHIADTTDNMLIRSAARQNLSSNHAN